MDFKKIHEDSRGFIYLVDGLLEDKKEFTFLEIRKGHARGGCLHSNDEYFVVIKGKVKYLHGDHETIMSMGESGKIPANVPHGFVALEDSIVSEWGITTEEKEMDKKDAKMREEIDKMNKKASSEIQ